MTGGDQDPELVMRVAVQDFGAVMSEERDPSARDQRIAAARSCADIVTTQSAIDVADAATVESSTPT